MGTWNVNAQYNNKQAISVWEKKAFISTNYSVRLYNDLLYQKL